MEMETLRYFSFHTIITFVRKYKINVALLDKTSGPESTSLR